MGRLTIPYPDGAIELKCSVNDAVNRLAAYEDTGLEPEELHAAKAALDTARKYPAFLPKLKRYGEAESEGHLIVLPDVPEKDRQSILDFLRECRADWIHDPSVGLFGPNENEAALMGAIEAALGGDTT